VGRDPCGCRQSVRQKAEGHQDQQVRRRIREGQQAIERCDHLLGGMVGCDIIGGRRMAGQRQGRGRPIADEVHPVGWLKLTMTAVMPTSR
jgi:hypothetical protein